MGTRARSSVQFKGQSVFVEAEARRSSFYRSGDLAKYLQRLGCKIEEFQTSQAIIVTADISKCVGGLPSPSQPSPVKNPAAAPIYESRAQKQLRLAREKSNPPKHAVTPNSKRTTTRDKSQKLYHIEKFEKLVKRSYHAFRRSNESSSLPSGSPKPANYKTPSKYSPPKRLVERNLPEPRPLIKPFLRIDDAEGICRPSFMENIPLPILKIDKVENDGCPFAGYEKKHREAKKKLARKMKAGNCEICDAKFDDEDAHVKTSHHQNALNKKRPHFHKLVKTCEQMFPNGFDGFLNRLEEFNAGDIPSPMPISVLTEPDSDETPYQNPTTGLGDSARSDIISARKPERLLSDKSEKTGEDDQSAAPPDVGNLEVIAEEQKEDFHDENMPPEEVACEDDEDMKKTQEDDESSQYRNFKHIESSFEKKNPTSTEPSDDPDWMFNQTAAMQSTNEKTEPERKISSEADWMIDELKKLKTGLNKEKRDVSMTMEDDTEVFKSDNPSDNLRKISSEAQKRKSTPAKGTYNPSTIGVLEQLASTSPRSNSGYQAVCSKSNIQSGLPSDYSKLSDSVQSPVIHKLKGTLQHSPKPAPLPLNLEDASRSPALKKAMMENPQGEKHQIETLRNLRGELDQTPATEIVKPNLTPVPREITRLRNDEPLPAPVMSAVLVSPKEKKTASTNPSPMDGKEFAVLQKTSSKSLLASLNNTGNESELRVENLANQNDAHTYDETDSYITINNETQDSETRNVISHADQFEFKTPTKTPRKRSIRKDENSPFPFSPTDSDFEIPSNQKKDINPLANRDNDMKSPVPVIPIYDQNSTAEKNDQIYHEFLTNPRKASFEGEVGKEVELHGTDNDTNDEAGFGGSASSLLCDPEHDMIISKNGKIRKGTKTTSALRGLDQSTIFRDSPRSTQRKSKVNAFNGLMAHHYEIPPVVANSDSSGCERTPLKRGTKTRSGSANVILKKEEKIFTLVAHAYTEDDVDEDSFKNSRATYSKRTTHDMSPQSRKAYFATRFNNQQPMTSSFTSQVTSSSTSRQAATKPKKTSMLESIIKTPDSSSPSDEESPVHNPLEDSSVDELPATPENDQIRVEFTTSDSDNFSPSPYRPAPARQSTRKVKRTQHKPRAVRQKSTDSENNEPIRRRQQQRSCRTRTGDRYGEGIRGFEPSSEEDF